MKLYTCLTLGAIFLGSSLQAGIPKPGSTAAKMASAIPEGPKVRALLERSVPYVLLEAKGEYGVINKVTGELLSSGSVGKRFPAHAMQEGLRWGEEYPDVFQITVYPRSKETTLFVNGIQYKGAISLYHTQNNKITVVNEVSIEDFLKSTLALEIDSSISKEALAAVVIAERTKLFADVSANAGSKKPWDLVAQEANYFGYAVTEPKSAIQEAVDWTRFMVLESSQKGGPLQHINLDAEKAQELASRGYDAKKILQSTAPSSKLGVTALPKNVR